MTISPPAICEQKFDDFFTVIARHIQSCATTWQNAVGCGGHLLPEEHSMACFILIAFLVVMTIVYMPLQRIFSCKLEVA